EDLRPHLPGHGPGARRHRPAAQLARQDRTRGAREGGRGAGARRRQPAGEAAARPPVGRRAAARLPGSSPGPQARPGLPRRAGHGRRLPRRARPPRPARGVPGAHGGAGAQGHHRDDHARHGCRALPRRQGGGAQPPPHGVRAARRRARQREAQGRVRSREPPARGGAVSDLALALSLPLFQRARAGGLLIALSSGLLGVFVVQRRLSFLGDGLAHAAFGGMGIGAFVIVATGLVGSGLALLRDPIWIAVPFSLLAAYGIYALRRRTDLSSDTAIGISFAVTVALGVMFFSLIPPDTNLGVSLMDLLFGSILGVR